MKRYWFYGMLPKDTISEDLLTNVQKQIIKKENLVLSKKNLYEKWIGYEVHDGWEFMRNGFEVIHIKEHRGNIARLKLVKILERKYL